MIARVCDRGTTKRDKKPIDNNIKGITSALYLQWAYCYVIDTGL
jgi:hypothetical protein